MKTFIILVASLAAFIGLVRAEEATADFNVRTQPTFKRIFDLGFRPSFVSQYSTSEVRDWNLHPITISIGNYKFKCVSEMTTFDVFDTGSLSRMTVVANRNAPASVEDALAEAEAFLNAAGAKESPVAQWREKHKSKGRIGFEGFGTNIEGNIRVSVEVYPHGIGDKLASLAVQIEWPYDGKLPVSERSRVPITTPEGYEWDMSFEEWSRRLREKENNKKQNKPEMAKPSKPSN